MSHMPVTSFASKKQGTTTEGEKLPRRLRQYYKRQNELIEVFEGLQQENDNADAANDANKALMKKSYILAKVSFVMNLLLLCGKAVAAGLSGSLAVITSVIDSAVDLVSGIVMWWSSRAMKNRDPYRYPQAAFATYDLQPPYLHNDSDVMCINISDMKQYVRVEGESGPVFGTESIVICAATICIKLVLFIVCRRVATPSAQALAQDQRNDVISNTGAVVCGLIGYRLWKYADPIGAIIISIYIIISWFLMGRRQIKMLTGHTAQPDFLKKLTFIAVNHHPKVIYIDTVRAFHFGFNFLVEVDIVLPEEMNLREAHNIGESLQQKLESLAEVERAFVHVDFDTNHDPSCEHKVV